MVRLDIHVKDKLNTDFRMALLKEGRHQKGELSKKISELMEDSLKTKNKDKGIQEYAIEDGKKVDLSKLIFSKKGTKEYSEGRRVMVRACHDIFIEYNGGILLVKRDDFPAKGLFWSVGGGIEKGTLIEESLRKKVKEECNLELKDIKFIGNVRGLWQTDPSSHGEGIDDISLVYSAKGEGNLKLNNLHKNSLIVKPKDYPKLRKKLHPWMKYFMDKLIKIK